MLAGREDGHLVALLPLFVYTVPRESAADGSLVAERIAAFLGAGNSDYLDLIAEPGLDAAAATACLERLDQRADRWEICQFEELRPDSPLLTVPTPQGWAEQRSPQVACPALALPAGTRELADVIPGRQTRNLRRLVRHAEQHGDVRIETADLVSCGRIFGALAHLHALRWHERGLPGVLAGEENEGFHANVIMRFAARGTLALHALHLGGEIAAVSYGFYERHEALYYLGSFDPRWAHCGPGALLLGAVIEKAIRRGCERFDFLNGSEPYKYYWGAKDRWNVIRRFRRETA